MDFNQLNYFVRAVELRSISDAAKALGVSQPAVTKGLHALEKELGAELLDRTRRGVKPTEIGALFFGHARAILGRAEQSVADVRRVMGDAPVSLRIGTTPSFVDYLLPTVIARFAQSWPSATIQVHKALYPELMGLLQTGEIDAAFAIQVEARERPGIKSTRLLPAETAFFVKAGHPLADMNSVAIEQLHASRWVLLDSADVDDYFDGLFTGVRLCAPEPVLRTNSMRLIKTLVMETELIGFLPAYIVSGDFESGALHRLQFDDGQPSPNAGLFYSTSGSPRPELLSLIEISQSAAASTVV